MMTEHQRIVFNGNGYSDEWVEEAERRGLPNLRSMVDAVPALLTPKAEDSVHQVRHLHQGGAGGPGRDHV